MRRTRAMSRHAVLGALAAICVLTAVPAMAQTRSSVEEITKRGVIKVGWGIWYPYMYRDPKNQQLAGITIDVFNAMGRDMGVKVEYVEDGWATIVAGLQAGKFDLTMPIAITPQRAQVVGYTKPITKINFGFMVPKKEIAKYKSWQDVDKAGKKIVTTLGSSNQPVAEQNIKNAQMMYVRTAPDSITQVLNGAADAWLSPLDSFAFVQKEHPDLAIVPGPAIASQQVSFAVRQGDAPLETWVSRWVERIKGSGELVKIIEKYGLDQTYVAD